MGRLTKWTDVRDTLNLEITPDILSDLSPEARAELTPYVDGYNLIIEFASTGEHDPGSFYDPSTAYPPETSEDRTMVAVYVEGGERYPLTPAVQQELFDRFYESIWGVELKFADRE